jgi:hypothetical protein
MRSRYIGDFPSQGSGKEAAMSISIVSNPDGSVTIACGGGGASGSTAAPAPGGITTTPTGGNAPGGWGQPVGGDLAYIHVGVRVPRPDHIGAFAAVELHEQIAAAMRELTNGSSARMVEISLPHGRRLDIDELRHQLSISGAIGVDDSLIIRVPPAARDEGEPG